MKMMSTGKFRPFDGYLNYPLKLIKTVPTTFFVGCNDPFANKDDAKWAYD